MKNPLLITLMAGSAMLLASAAASAQPNGGHGDRGDRGGRGEHSRQGGPGGGMERGMMMLRVADANGDNSITRAEIDALQTEMFAWMDRNGDGFLDDADQSPMHQRMRAMRTAEAGADEADRPAREGRRGSNRGDRRGPGGPGAEGGPRGEGGMSRADADEDGRISRAEFLGMDHPSFDRLDQDSDGVVTPAELDAAVEQRDERRQERRHWWRN